MPTFKGGYSMSNYELMKKETERHRVLGAKMEMELKVYEREQDIVRLKENIKNQEQKILELDEEIKALKEQE